MNDDSAPRMKWLLWPIVGSALLITVQAWNDDGRVSQALPASALTDTANARLNPTAHPAVPARLEAMWYVPVAEPPSAGAIANFAKGVEILEDQGNTSEALPLVSHAALEKTAVANDEQYKKKK